MNSRPFALAAVALAIFALPAAAQQFTMNFDGPGGAGIPKAVPPPDLPPGTGDQFIGSALLGYYDNDPGYERDGRQPWNVTFDPGALAVARSQGNFPTPPSGLYALESEGSSIYFDVNPGLRISELSFFYNVAGSGANAGFALFSRGTLVSGPKSLEGCVNPSAGWCDWKEYAVPEGDLAGQLVTRVVFSGAGGQVAFDNVSVNAVPVPEPTTQALMVIGIAAIAAIGRRKR